MCAVICADLIPDFFAETGCTGEVTTKKMNVLMLNGSPNPNVNTSIVLREMENVFRENDVESETVFAATGIFTAASAASAALRPENASLPTSRTSLPRNSRRRGNRNGGKVTDFRKAEIWLLGYPGILGSISQAERREVCSQGELSPTCGEDRVFFPSERVP